MLPLAARRRRIARIGASPVPPASSSSGESDSRRKKLPCGPVNCTESPTDAQFSSQSDMTPPGESLTRNVSCSSSGPLENEYDRVWSVPGTAMLTYWPGRNTSFSRSSQSSASDIVVDESRSIAATVAVKLPALVLATADVVGICTTRSDLGDMLHVRT